MADDDGGSKESPLAKLKDFFKEHKKNMGLGALAAALLAGAAVGGEALRKKHEKDKK